MTLTAAHGEILAVLARGTDERPWPLYRMQAGPSLPLPDHAWVAVPQSEVDALVEAGLLAAVMGDDGRRVAYWTITDLGREALADPTGEPAPAASRRRRQRKA